MSVATVTSPGLKFLLEKPTLPRVKPPRISGRLKVVAPSPTPAFVPITANNSEKSVRDTALPSQNKNTNLPFVSTTVGGVIPKYGSSTAAGIILLPAPPEISPLTVKL